VRKSNVVKCAPLTVFVAIEMSMQADAFMLAIKQKRPKVLIDNMIRFAGTKGWVLGEATFVANQLAKP
jgi:hypothetical protein